MLAPTGAGGLADNGALCHCRQVRSDPRGWASELDKTKSGDAHVSPDRQVKGEGNSALTLRRSTKCCNCLSCPEASEALQGQEQMVLVVPVMALFAIVGIPEVTRESGRQIWTTRKVKAPRASHNRTISFAHATFRSTRRPIAYAHC
ncbi:hypothetical protein HNQ44_003149 [Planomicrobium koreense]|uniref:Uncharacterized protein n=1 Tax=Planococcus koreensis TaxID=112331 RepID=A0A7W8CWH1_9BACL|nr:hypothetical protein [Planococcus koreensis]